MTGVTLDHFVDTAGKVVDVAGVTVTIVGALLALGLAARRAVRRDPDNYRLLRRQLGRSVLLGLELLVAGDIIRTVAVEPTVRNITVLAEIVLVRTFLSVSLETEISGRWPWQRRDQPPKASLTPRLPAPSSEPATPDAAGPG
jgi:uncharacterized membrane protein